MVLQADLSQSTTNHLRQVLRTELDDDLPSSYSVGYFEGRYHAKRWLTTDRDVVAMRSSLVVMCAYGVMLSKLKVWL